MRYLCLIRLPIIASTSHSDSRRGIHPMSQESYHHRPVRAVVIAFEMVSKSIVLGLVLHAYGARRFPIYHQCDPMWGNDEMGVPGQSSSTYMFFPFPLRSKFFRDCKWHFHCVYVCLVLFCLIFVFILIFIVVPFSFRYNSICGNSLKTSFNSFLSAFARSRLCYEFSGDGILSLCRN